MDEAATLRLLNPPFWEADRHVGSGSKSSGCGGFLVWVFARLATRGTRGIFFEEGDADRAEAAVLRERLDWTVRPVGALAAPESSLVVTSGSLRGQFELG